MRRPELLYGKKKNTLSRVLTVAFGAFFAIVFLVSLAEMIFYAQYLVVSVDGRSMLYTLYDKDIVYAKRNTAPERGDVVMIRVNGGGWHDTQFSRESEFIIKRCIALEGDTVYAEQGIVYLKKAGEEDFSVLEEPYANYVNPDSGINEQSDYYFRSVTVGKGEIFFLGDDRPLSLDSHLVGCRLVAQVEGVVPQWAIDHKEAIQGFEGFRASLSEGMRAFLGFFGIK